MIEFFEPSKQIIYRSNSNLIGIKGLSISRDTHYLSKCTLCHKHVDNIPGLTPEVNFGQAIVIFKSTFSAFKYTIGK